MYLLKKAVGILGWDLNIPSKITGDINLFVVFLWCKKYLLRLKIVCYVSAYKQYWYTLHRTFKLPTMGEYTSVEFIYWY